MGKINKKELHQIFGELRNKNQNAYNNLYEKYYNLVYGITYSILKNKEDSEDISHEIFTKIYKLDVDKLPTNNEASWLFTVSKNECFAFFRKTKPNLSIDEIYEIPSSSNELENVIDSEYYNKIIDRLKEDEKQIVSLKVLSNFTFKKISQVMNVPIGTVQWKYYNAINSLRISVGSLVGAITAFVIILARGEFWKSKQYMNQNQTNDVDNEENNFDNAQQESMEDKNVENSNQINQDNVYINEENKENDKEKEDSVYSSEGNTFPNEIGENIVENTTIDANVENVGFSRIWKDKNQLVILSIGLVLIIISIIFFKKYQQKFKKKSSK